MHTFLLIEGRSVSHIMTRPFPDNTYSTWQTIFAHDLLFSGLGDCGEFLESASSVARYGILFMYLQWYSCNELLATEQLQWQFLLDGNNHRTACIKYVSNERLWNSKIYCKKNIWKSNDNQRRYERSHVKYWACWTTVESHLNHSECPIASHSQVKYVSSHMASQMGKLLI